MVLSMGQNMMISCLFGFVLDFCFVTSAREPLHVLKLRNRCKSKKTSQSGRLSTTRTLANQVQHVAIHATAILAFVG